MQAFLPLLALRVYGQQMEDPELCKKIEASGLSLEEYLGITSKYRN
jgi:hypothetical protein